MFAIVKISSTQYKVEPKQKLKVVKLKDEEGKTVKFDKVLLVDDEKGKTKIGDPLVKGAEVEAKILKHGRGDKIRVFKKKPKKRYERTQGHRQDYTEIEVTKIKA